MKSRFVVAEGNLTRTVRSCTVHLRQYVSIPTRKGAEEARNQLPDLLTAAEKGRSTIITKHGRPVAALVPMMNFEEGRRQKALLSVKGSGRGLWGEHSRKTLHKIREEWER